MGFLHWLLPHSLFADTRHDLLSHLVPSILTFHNLLEGELQLFFPEDNTLLYWYRNYNHAR